MSGITTQLSPDSGEHVYPKTDGTWLAWTKRSAGSASPYELILAPVDNPTSTVTRSTALEEFVLQDGMLAWVERGDSAKSLIVDDGTETTIATSDSIHLFSTGNGYLIFSDEGRLYVWNRAQDRRLLMETLPKQVLQSDNYVFFTVGFDSTTIYRVTL